MLEHTADKSLILYILFKFYNWEYNIKTGLKKNPHTRSVCGFFFIRPWILPAGGEHPDGAGCTAPRPPVR